jgi:isopentenyldiphosphate isomerase
LDPDRDEVDEAKLIDVADLKQDVRDRPDRYTPWFKISLDRVLDSRCAGGSPRSRG